MENLNAEEIEKYQILLQKDPFSKVFAPLAEAYRKLGLLEEALKVASRGVQEHPEFASGRVALSRVLMDRENFQDALMQLEKATELAPENLMALSLLGECHVRTKNPKKALKAFKMLLFLNPLDERARDIIQKFESLTADEYDEDVFEMKPLSDDIVLNSAEDLAETIQPLTNELELERVVSLADAYIVRNDIERAEATLLNGEKLLGAQKEITKRMELIKRRQTLLKSELQTLANTPIPSRDIEISKKKIAFLRQLLHQIDARKKNTASANS